jgi:G patch domain-containing protein 1
MPVQRLRTNIDNLIFMTELNKGTKDEVESSTREVITEVELQGTANDPDIELSSMQRPVQRPVDLYKVSIYSLFGSSY